MVQPVCPTNGMIWAITTMKCAMLVKPNRVLNVHLIGFLLCKTKLEWKSALKIRGIMSLQKFKVEYVAGKRQYTAASGEVQVPCGAIYEWRKEEQGIDARFNETNAILRELYPSVVKKWEHSNTAKLSIFKSVVVAIFTCRHESWLMVERVLSQVLRWDFCEEFTVQHFTTKCTSAKIVKPWMSNHFSLESRGPSYVGSAMCPDCPRKDWRGKSCWLHLRESRPGQRLSKDQVKWLHLQS